MVVSDENLSNLPNIYSHLCQCADYAVTGVNQIICSIQMRTLED